MMRDRVKEPENQLMQEGVSLKKYYHISKFTLKEFFEMGIQIAAELEKYAMQGVYAPVVSMDHIFFLEAQGWKLGNFELSDNPQMEAEEQDERYGMPPEYYEGHESDEAGRVYELGILLYRLLNYMEMPFEDICQSEWEAERMRRSAAMPKPPKFGTDSLQKLICTACASRENRYHSLKEFREHLEYFQSCLPKEWQDTAITGHSYKDGDYIHRSFEPKKVAEVKKTEPVKKEETPVQTEKKPEKDKKVVSDEKKKQKAAEKEKLKKQKENEKAIKDAQKKQQKEQEAKYGNQNKKDMYLVIGIVIAFIAVIILVIMLVGNSKNNQIYQYIESAAYGTAMSEMEELYEEGENIDEVVCAFIEACMSDREYKRIPDAISWLSEEYCEQNEAMFREIIQQMLSSGKITRAEDVLNTMEGIGGVRAQYAAAIRQE